MTNEQHNKYAAFALFAHGGFQLLLALAMFAISYVISLAPQNPNDPPPVFFYAMFGFMAFLYLLFGVPSVVAGYGMLKKKSWARIAAIVAGVVSAMNVPIGTAACVYVLWFFMGDNWKSVYGEEPSAASVPGQLNQGVDTAWATDERARQEWERFRAGPPDWR